MISDCGFEEISVMNSPYEDIRHVFSNLYRGVRAQEKRSKVNSHIKLANIEEFKYACERENWVLGMS